MELFALRELSDIFVDACVRDESGSLLLLSCYGRDTALQQMFAAFSLPAKDGGFDALRLVAEDKREHRVTIGRAERFKKLTGRLPKHNLFGNLAQVWVYDEALLQPDRANRVGWVLAQREAEADDTQARVWAMVELLSPVPLLAHWRAPVLDAIGESILRLGSSAYPPLGRIDAVRVQVPESFPAIVSQLVRAGAIGLEPGATGPAARCG